MLPDPFVVPPRGIYRSDVREGRTNIWAMEGILVQMRCRDEDAKKGNLLFVNSYELSFEDKKYSFEVSFDKQ